MNLGAAELNRLAAPEILNALADGAYITDTDRRILFWNQAAERITGWPAAEVVGRSCRDNILVHIDKDHHPLCGEEYCPLHRSIVTGQSSTGAVLVFAQTKSGQRVPVEVMVSPIRGPRGEVVGGIEVFRDLTLSMQDLTRAQDIQRQSLECHLPPDGRVEFAVRYTPNELVGGDFYRMERLDADRYAVMVADVMGHGVAAALYTMQLRSLWDDHRAELPSPSLFLTTINRRLQTLAGEAGYFGTAVFALWNAATGELRYVRAGHPAPLLIRRGGAVERLPAAGPALGMFADLVYEDAPVQLGGGDALLLYTDGAVEVTNTDGEELGTDGLAQLLCTAGSAVALDRLEECLLRYSNQIRLADDLTLLKIRRP